jgi:hypothetical protein
MSRGRLLAAVSLAAVSLAAACGPARPMNGPSMNNRMNAPPPPSSPVVSGEVLRREPRANRTRVKHILIGWRDLADNYGGRLDERAAARDKAAAEAEIEALRAQLAAGVEFDVLMRARSEDTGLAANPDGYVVTPDAQLVLDFRRIGLRLEVGEVGVVETEFGFHLVQRVE